MWRRTCIIATSIYSKGMVLVVSDSYQCRQSTALFIAPQLHFAGSAWSRASATGRLDHDAINDCQNTTAVSGHFILLCYIRSAMIRRILYNMYRNSECWAEELAVK